MQLILKMNDREQYIVPQECDVNKVLYNAEHEA
jgi:hypothetical protein